MSAARVGSIGGRLVLLDERRALDVAEASNGRFGPDPLDAYAEWTSFLAWARDAPMSAGAEYCPADLGTPVPRPSQVFAIGLNYAEHAAESRMTLPEHPVVFTKFASSLAGADVAVALTGDRTDWEAELVVVMGVAGRDIPVASAWDHVAGLAVGQDLSNRTVQGRGNPAQFSLGKSFEGYSPVGPVTPVAWLPAGVDRDDLGIRCTISAPGVPSRVLQDGRTRDMVFSVPELVHRLSAIVELRPGDLIFTGTPSGVGIGRDPQEFLAPGQELVTEIEGLGRIRQEVLTR